MTTPCEVPSEAFDEYFALYDAYCRMLEDRGGNRGGLRYSSVTHAHEFALAYMQCRRLDEVLRLIADIATLVENRE